MLVCGMKSICKKYKELPVYAKAAGWFIICSFLQRAVSLLTTPIFTRMLSTSEYGFLSLYNSWQEIISILVTLKLSEAVFNKSLTKVKEDKRRKLLSEFQIISCVLSFLFFLLFYFMRAQLSAYIGLEEWMLMFMLIQILFDTSIKLWTGYQKYEYRYMTLIILTLILAVLNPCLSLAFIYSFENNLFGRIFGIVLSYAAVGLFAILYNLHGMRETNCIDLKATLKYVLGFSIPLVPHYLSQILLSQVDRIMIDYIVNEEAVALYSLAYTISLLATMVTQSINNAYVPWMFRMANKGRTDEIYQNNILLLLTVSVVIFLLCLVSPEIVLILGGKQYIPATRVIYPVASGVFFMFMYTLYANIELYYEKKMYITIGTVITALINMILNYLFIPRFGYIAAAYTTLFSYLGYGFFHVVIAKRIFQKQYVQKADVKIEQIVLISIATIALTLGCSLISELIVLRYALLLGAFLLVLIKRKVVIRILKTIKKGEY